MVRKLGVRWMGALVIAGMLLAPGAAQAKSILDWLLGEPGSGIHVIPDPRPPHAGPPSQGDPTPPPPPTYGTLINGFIKMMDDINAMKNWYTALTEAEQAKYKPQYDAALARVSAGEDALAKTIVDPLETGNERPLYQLFDLIRHNDAIRARAVFLGLLDKLAVQINMDYINDSQNPIKARRARDVVTLRAWVGR